MDGSFDTLTIILLIVAVIIFLKLRSVLGRKTGQERPPFEPYRRSGTGPATAGANTDPAGTLGRRSGDATVGVQTRPSIEERLDAIVAADSKQARPGLLAIAGADPNFDPSHFLAGAKAAYEMIVTEFAAGNRKALKPLLAPEVYEGFVSAIGDRESRGEKVETRFVGINRTEIVDADLKNATAQISVRFLSQLITATRNKVGELIDGDPKKVCDLADVWTFAREVTSSNPNWRLIATQQAT